MNFRNSLSSTINYFNNLRIDDIRYDIFDLSSTDDNIIKKPSLSDIIEEENYFPIIKIGNNIIKPEEKIKRIKFKVEFCKKKRGRKTTKEIKKPVHTALTPDNIHTKIQTHFLNFIISFINDCVRSFSFEEKIHFLNFNHYKKAKVSKEYFQEMKNYSIKELLLKMDISVKYKKYDKRINIVNLEKLTKNDKDDWFQKIFSIKYLELFSLYYNNAQPLNELSFSGKKIFFSKKTKPFYYLLQKNKELKEHIINYSKIFYFPEENTLESD